MRKKEIIKSILLGLLIFTSIIQTTMLWLGGIPGQYFFRQNQVENNAVMPYGIWLVKPSAGNTGALGAFAYPIDYTLESTKREYDRLVTELVKLLKSPEVGEALTITEGINWEKLFGVPTICYEYSVPLSMGELSGTGQTNVIVQQIDTIIIPIDQKDRSQIHLVSTLEDRTYTVETTSVTQEFRKLYEYFTSSERLAGVTSYQPSSISNINQYIRGNVFMPIASSNTPMEYEVLSVYNPIRLTNEGGMKILERYVNGFFINPMLKDVEKTEDGQIIFTEATKGMVIYNPKGVIEYINLASKAGGAMNKLSGYQCAMQFLEKTDAVTDEVKESLYLSDIQVRGQVTTYYFDMVYKGHKIKLSSQLKRELGIEAIVAIAVQSNQVVGSTIATYQFEPLRLGNDIQTMSLRSEYVDPINEVLELLLAEGQEEVVFDTSEAVYLMNSLEGKIFMTRSVAYGGRWYYP